MTFRRVRAPGGSPRRSARNEYLWAASVLAILLGSFFSPIVRSHSTFSSVSNLQQYFYPWIGVDPPTSLTPLFPQVDQADYVYPRQVFLDTTVRRTGQLPLWNPMTLGGTPFLAETGSRLAYPPMVAVTLLLNPVHAHDAYLIFHLFVAGMAMFALLKAFGTRFGGALIAAVSWTFASYTMAWIMLEMFAAVAALLPLALLFVFRWQRDDSRPDLLAATLILGLLLLGTSLELALLCFLVVVGYAGILQLGRMFHRRSGWKRRDLIAMVGQPAVLVLGSLAVAAIALLPFLSLSGGSQRGAPDASIATRYGVPVRSFISILRPPSIPPDVAGRVTALISQQVFVGTATACLALLGLVRRRAGRGLGTTLLVVLFLFSTGSVVAKVTYAVVPFLGNLAGAGRSLFLFDLGLAILGGLGLDNAVTVIRRAGRTAASAPGEAPPTSTPRRVVAVVVVTVCVTATSAQLLSYGRRVNPPFQPRTAAALFPSTPVIDAVKDVTGRDPGRERVLVVAPLNGPYTLVSTTGLALDLPLVNGYEPVVPANVSTIWRVVNGEAPTTAYGTPWNQTFQLPFLSSSVRTDLLARLGVAALVGPPGAGLGPGWSEAEAARRGLQRTYVGNDGQVFAVTGRPPRALVVQAETWVKSQEDALSRFISPEFDVRREVVFAGRGPTAGTPSPSPASGPAPARVSWLQDDPNEVRMSVAAAEAGWLVLLDNWDPGWTATVNGHRARVERANFTQRAVRVPKGTSTVAFSYRPSSVRFGAVLSAVAAIVLDAVLIADLTRRRRRSQRSVTSTTGTASTG